MRSLREQERERGRAGRQRKCSFALLHDLLPSLPSPRTAFARRLSDSSCVKLKNTKEEGTWRDMILRGRQELGRERNQF